MIYGGVNVMVVPTWVRDWSWWRIPTSAGRVPSKREGRRGTRRAWKRRHPVGLRWTYGPVEPDHVINAGSVIYCTARQAAELRYHTEARAA